MLTRAVSRAGLLVGKEKESRTLGTSVPNAELLPGHITLNVMRYPHTTN